MQLITPTLVDVRGRDGTLRPALLLARRDDRRFVQVSHAAGDNRLRWVDAGDVCEAAGPVRPAVAPGQGGAIAPSGAVALLGPRASR